MKKILATIVALAAMSFCASAAEYVVTGTTTNIFQEPSTDSPMPNQWEDLIDILPGMAFEKTGEAEGFWRVNIPGWNGAWLPKSACVTPEKLDLQPGTYQFVYEEESYPVTITAGDTEGTFKIDYRDGANTYTGTLVEPGVVIMTDPRFEGSDVTGSISCVGGKTRVWIYDTTVLPWN